MPFPLGLSRSILRLTFRQTSKINSASCVSNTRMLLQLLSPRLVTSLSGHGGFFLAQQLSKTVGVLVSILALLIMPMGWIHATSKILVHFFPTFIFCQ
jgi:hypothetical protein